MQVAEADADGDRDQEGDADRGGGELEVLEQLLPDQAWVVTEEFQGAEERVYLTSPPVAHPGREGTLRQDQ